MFYSCRQTGSDVGLLSQGKNIWLTSLIFALPLSAIRAMVCAIWLVHASAIQKRDVRIWNNTPLFGLIICTAAMKKKKQFFFWKVEKANQTSLWFSAVQKAVKVQITQPKLLSIHHAGNNQIYVCSIQTNRRNFFVLISLFLPVLPIVNFSHWSETTFLFFCVCGCVGFAVAHHCKNSLYLCLWNRKKWYQADFNLASSK